MKDGKNGKIGVLIIGPVAPPVGGMAVSLDNIVNSKLKDKYKFYVLDVTGFRTRNRRAGLLRGIYHQFYLIYKLIRILLYDKPCIAHVQMTTSFYFYRRSIDIVICKLFRAKVIFHLRGGRFITFYNGSPRLGKWIIRSTLAICDRTIALSRYWADYLSTLMDRRKISTIPNGVVLSDFRLRDNKRASLGFSEDDVVILFVGPIGRMKGSFDLLNAIALIAKEVRNVRFIFCGTGEFEGEILRFKNRVDEEKLSENVKYVENVTGQEKIDYYLSSDIFTLPSYIENLPNVLLEAMAAGLPVVVSDVGAIPEVVTDGVNGYIIKAGDVDAIAEKLKRLALDGGLRKSMGALNRRVAEEKYNMPIIADKLGEVYNGLLKKKSHIVHVLYSFGLGGLEGVIASLVNRMDADIFSHSICIFHGDFSSQEKIHISGVRVHVIRKYFRHDPTAVIRLAWILRKISPDVVCTYNWMGTDGIIAAILSGVRAIIHSEHGFDARGAQKQKRRRVIIRRILFKACARVIVVSRALQKWIIEDVKVGKDKVLYIPNGCDIAKFHPGREPELRRRFGIRDNCVVVGTVGSLTKVKDQRSLIRAFAGAERSFTNLRLMLVGNGPLRKELEDLTVELGIKERVIFTGGVIDTSPFYRAMDIFAITSISENMPLALLEAMATALPVIATDVGDVGYMLNGERGGIVTKPMDIYAIETGIISFLKSPGLSKEKSIFARKRVEELFDIAPMISTYEKLYLSLRK